MQWWLLSSWSGQETVCCPSRSLQPHNSHHRRAGHKARVASNLELSSLQGVWLTYHALCRHTAHVWLKHKWFCVVCMAVSSTHHEAKKRGYRARLLCKGCAAAAFRNCTKHSVWPIMLCAATQLTHVKSTRGAICS